MQHPPFGEIPPAWQKPFNSSDTKNVALAQGEGLGRTVMLCAVSTKEEFPFLAANISFRIRTLSREH